MEILVNTEIPTRLDRYLRRKYNAITQGVLEQSLRKGLIKVNGQKTQANFRVLNEDKIFISDKLLLQPIEKKSLEFSKSVIELEKKIFSEYRIYSHEDFIAINKPPNLSVQGGSKISLSIDDALKYAQSMSNDCRLVHRLDKRTSGVLLIAKNYLAAYKLTNAFHNKIIKKTYLAIVWGKPSANEGEISNFITKKHGKVHITDENFGKLAITKYKVIKDLGNKSLIEFTPITGRIHQLRVHSQSLGCNIIGDNKYGKDDNEKNLLLHAKQILIHSSLFGEEIIIEAPIPSYFVFPSNC